MQRIRSMKRSMKPKTVVKMFVDLAMLVLYLLLTFNYSANTLFHEVAGIGIGALFAAHVALNWRPFKNMLKRAGEGKLSTGKSIQLAGDLILPFGMATCIVTGLLIAKDLFMGPGDAVFVTVHNLAAYVCLAILALHLLQHARYLVGVFKQSARTSFAQKTTACAGALLMVGAMLGSDIYLGAQDRITAALSGSTTQAVAQGTGDSTSTSTSTTTGTSSTTVNDRSQRGSRSSSASGTSSSSSSSVSSSSSSSSSNSSVSQGTASSSDTSTTVLNCTQCHKNCPITALQCAKGTSWATANGYI